MVGGVGDNKVVATLRADGSVYPASGTSMGQLANLMNYKIRTEVDVSNKSLNTFSAPTTVVDLGKQLLQYARDGDLKGVKNLLSRGAPFTSDWLGMSALHFAAMNNQYEICDALLKGGINKDSKTKVDRTPLHVACFYGNERIVELLLSKKCAVNPRDMLRMTPLHWAVEKGHKSIVRMLLKHNADVTISSKFGKTPIALAVLTEQADLLAELETTRQAQVNRKFSEEHEKETSDAVNSIMGLANFGTEEPATTMSTTLRKMDVDTEDELTNNSDFAEEKIVDFSSIKETGTLDKSTINLLKSHGISMMPEDDDASKQLLTTALRNGRQLVLSEGGKLLLNETKKIQNNNNNDFNSNQNSGSKGFATMPMRVKNQTSRALTQQSQVNKTPGNFISKAKDNLNVYKNKNIRIISLNDFKKLYGNTNLKAMQKMPATIANSRFSKPSNESTRVPNVSSRQVHMNLRQAPHAQQVKAEAPVIEEDFADSIIQLAPSDSDTEMEQQDIVQPQQASQSQKPLQHTRANSNAPICLVPTTKQVSGTLTTRQLAAARQTTSNTSKASSEASKQTPTISLLSVPEICRQLYELRRQNDELKHKFEMAQKEKEELRQRLDRLEELLLVEKTDEDYSES